MEEDLTNVSLNLEQARDLLAQLSAALDGRQGLLEIVMPNDKKMSDCTGHYVRQVSEALHRISLNSLRGHPSGPPLKGGNPLSTDVKSSL
jgi:hypothetical protein